MINELNDNGVYATDNADALAEYINEAKEQAGSYEFLDASTDDTTDPLGANNADSTSTTVVVEP